jgi:GH43 family beta-xylosidase
MPAVDDTRLQKLNLNRRMKEIKNPWVVKKTRTVMQKYPPAHWRAGGYLMANRAF